MAFVRSFGGIPAVRNVAGLRLCKFSKTARLGRASLSSENDGSKEDEEIEVILPKLDVDEGLTDVEEATVPLPILDTDEMDEFRLMWKLKKEMNEGDFKRIFKSNDPRIGDIF
mmetsp:Transcript_27279/g.106560  ORF Transcript_27279/g.106560 Transcript_27279/m.106560 type:complete len:113 (+) Transcript_27279:4765-5103(+)|eukprot:CAMPEP_0113957286 /NCGR_PEP_ID=MMETSP0011_2-20120614/2681_1 /TAXON_ID=101924 /ORGANISM="Rhodosorus marinus" /LENGTH=112 /DNA_ID=CAMNT_0000967823 /DNA_START=120 /DNA_END=458 /DNA_ORIENTATION=- /assembly_acc=CAM_ASM_000156